MTSTPPTLTIHPNPQPPAPPPLLPNTTTLSQSSCAEGRCLICLAGAPLIPKSEEKTWRREREISHIKALSLVDSVSIGPCPWQARVYGRTLTNVSRITAVTEGSTPSYFAAFFVLLNFFANVWPATRRIYSLVFVSERERKKIRVVYVTRKINNTDMDSDFFFCYWTAKRSLWNMRSANLYEVYDAFSVFFLPVGSSLDNGRLVCFWKQQSKWNQIKRSPFTHNRGTYNSLQIHRGPLFCVKVILYKLTSFL